MAKTRVHTTEIYIDANLTLNNNKLVDVANGTANTDGVNLSQLNSSISNLDSLYVKLSTANSANGYAKLDTNSKISTAQMPNGVEYTSNKVTTLSTSTTQYPSCSAVRNFGNDTYIAKSEKGAVSGVASLDSNGKVVASQLPDSVVGALVYQGTVGTGGTVTQVPTAAASNKGHYYVCISAGTYGGHACEVHDWVVSNGASWDRLDARDAVTEVAGLKGVVTAANLKTALNVQAVSVPNPNTGKITIDGTAHSICAVPPTNVPAANITTDTNNRFVSDEDKARWNTPRYYDTAFSLSGKVATITIPSGKTAATNIAVFKNGGRMKNTIDYTISGTGTNVVTFADDLPTTTNIVIDCDFS